MNRKKEEKIISQILALCKEEKEVPKQMEQAKVNLIIWSVIFLVIVVVLSSNGKLNSTVGALLIFISGLLGGGAVFQAIANKQWPILKKTSKNRKHGKTLK